MRIRIHSPDFVNCADLPTSISMSDSLSLPAAPRQLGSQSLRLSRLHSLAERSLRLTTSLWLSSSLILGKVGRSLSVGLRCLEHPIVQLLKTDTT